MKLKAKKEGCVFWILSTQETVFPSEKGAKFKSSNQYFVRFVSVRVDGFRFGRLLFCNLMLVVVLMRRRSDPGSRDLCCRGSVQTGI